MCRRSRLLLCYLTATQQSDGRHRKPHHRYCTSKVHIMPHPHDPTFDTQAQPGSVHMLQADACFHGLFSSCSYSIHVQEDAAAAAKHEATAARRAALKEQEQSDSLRRPGAKAGVDRITQQLQRMHADDRTGMGSEEFRALKEARDLEDILFS